VLPFDAVIPDSSRSELIRNLDMILFLEIPGSR